MKINPRKELNNVSPYVPGKPVAEVKRELGLADRMSDEIVKLASNENVLGPSESAVRAMREALSETYLYPEGSGYELRKAIAEKNNIDIDNVILGAGSDEIGQMIGLAYMDGTNSIIVGEYGFIRYEMTGNIMGARVLKTKMPEFRYDVDAILNSLDGSVIAVFVCNPNNPTGTIVNKKDMEKLIGKIPENVLIVVDEAYFEYVDSDDYETCLKYIGEKNNVIVLRTFSKIYCLAGLRVGYGISSPEVISALNKVRCPFNVNSIGQTGAVASIKDEKHVSDSRKMKNDGYVYLTGELDKLGVEYVESYANFVLIDVKTDSRKVFNSLLKEGVIVRPMTEYNLNNYIRVTIGKKNHNEKFIRALKLAMFLTSC